MHKFVGQYEHNLDEKGRLTIPVKFRHFLGEKFYLCMSLTENCLWALPESEWQRLNDKYLSEISPFDKEGQNFLSLFTSLATECEFDKQGRILIPQNLRLKIKLEKAAVLVGKLNFIEIYSESIWKSVLSGGEVSQIAQEYFEKGKA